MFVMLKDAGLSPDLCSYAAALQCMGRRDQDVHIIRRWVWSVLAWPVPLGQAGPPVLTLHRPVPRCLRCLKEMVEAGFQPQQLFTDLDLAGDERAALLRAVRKAEPAFSLPPQAPDPVNTSTLLKEIYAKVSPTREAATTSGRLTCRHRLDWRLPRRAPTNLLGIPVLGTSCLGALYCVAFCVWLTDDSVLKVPTCCGICWSLAPIHGSVVFQCVVGHPVCPSVPAPWAVPPGCWVHVCSVPSPPGFCSEWAEAVRWPLAWHCLLRPAEGSQVLPEAAPAPGDPAGPL